MNRAITDNPASLTSDQLPPARAGAAARLLFLTNYALGFKTLAAQLEAFAKTRDNVDAVHVRMSLTGANRWLGRTSWQARGMDLGGLRQRWAWASHMKGLFDQIDPTRFDCALVTTQSAALGMIEIQRRTGLPFGVFVDTTHRLYVDKLGGDRVTEKSINRIEKRIFDSAAFVASMSTWGAESVIRDYKIDPAKVIVVRNAVPIAPVAAVGSPAGSKPRIVIVGNDWVRKGGDRLLAWHQARWVDRAELHVVSAAAPASKGERSVVWHGKVEYARLLGELLPTMDIFALPTTNDMSPWAAIEASGIGLPVASSRLGALGEIVIDGETGFLSLAHDDAAHIAAIERLIEGAELRKRMGTAGRARMMAEFSPEKNYGRLVEQMSRAATIRA